MNRADFLRRLERALQAMPEEERRRAIEYYENYFDEAGVENEPQVLEELGAPEKVAADILQEFRDVTPTQAKQNSGTQDKTQQAKSYFQSLDNGQKTLLICLGVLAAVVILPAMLGLVGGIGGILIGIVCVIIGVFAIVPCLCLASWLAAVICLVMAGTTVMTDLAASLLCLGLALLFLALDILLGRLASYLFGTVFPAALNGTVAFIRRLFGGK